MSAERLARIGPVMQRYIDEQLVAGTITLIARRGKVVHFEARGFMDAERRIPMRPDAFFRIASMAKPITSVALMMLWEEGHFQLTDPVAKYLPEFSDVKVSTTGDVSAETGTLVEPDDPLYDEAVAYVTQSRRASISSVQRKLKIGYNRAARLVEAMEMAGVVSEAGHNGQREVIAPPPV